MNISLRRLAGVVATATVAVALGSVAAHGGGDEFVCSDGAIGVSAAVAYSATYGTDDAVSAVEERLDSAFAYHGAPIEHSKLQLSTGTRSEGTVDVLVRDEASGEIQAVFRARQLSNGKYVSDEAIYCTEADGVTLRNPRIWADRPGEDEPEPRQITQEGSE